MHRRWLVVTTVLFGFLSLQTVSATTVLEGWIDVTEFMGSCATVAPKDRDTCMFQRALNSIGAGPHPGNSGPNVLHIPAGTYTITQTLYIEGHRGIQLVGDTSAGGVTLRWTGPSGKKDLRSGYIRPAVMFHSDGNIHATFRNITWDGGAAQGRQFVVAFDHSWCGKATGSLCSGGNYNPQCNGLGNPWYVPDCNPAQDSDCKLKRLYCKAGENDTASAHMDSVFRNAWIGLRIGHYNRQVDELTVRRVRFVDNTIGVSIEDANALQEQFWDCDFERNSVAAITNATSALGYYDPELGNKAFGDFRVMRGWFAGNGLDKAHGIADVYLKAAGNYTFRECRSTGSRQFLASHGSGTTRPLSMIGLEISDYDGNHAIQLDSPGPLVLIGNRIDAGDSGGPVVRVGGQAGAASSILALDNSYTVAAGGGEPDCPGSGSAYNHAPALSKRCVGDSFDIDSSELDEFDRPAVIDVLAGRAVYTVAMDPGVDDYTAVIQAAIEAAAANAPAVVHVQDGSYKISETLHVDSGSGLVLLGNGAATEIKWAGQTEGPMLEIDGALAGVLTLRDLHFDALTETYLQAEGIRVRNLDPAGGGGRVLLNRVYATHAPAYSGDGIVALGPDRTRIDVMDSTLSKNERGFVAHAGVLPRASGSGIAVWTATVLHNQWDFDLYNNGDVIDGNGDGLDFLVSSTYMEESTHFLRATGQYGESDICIHGSKAATDESTDPNAVSLVDLRGNVGVVNSWSFDLDDPADGALIGHEGTAPLAIELMANTIATVPEYSADVSVIRTATLCDVPDAGEPHPENACEGTPGIASAVEDEPLPWGAAEDALLYDGLKLLRTVPPGFYDEAGATASHQINLDNVHVFDATRGIVLLGFGECPQYRECGPGCQPSNCSWIDTREIGCMDNEELAQCPPGETVFIQTCGCSGGVCMASSTIWSCEIACTTDSHCDDGLFCNGENCNGLFCDDPCPGQECDEELDQCM